MIYIFPLILFLELSLHKIIEINFKFILFWLLFSIYFFFSLFLNDDQFLLKEYIFISLTISIYAISGYKIKNNLYIYMILASLISLFLVLISESNYKNIIGEIFIPSKTAFEGGLAWAVPLFIFASYYNKKYLYLIIFIILEILFFKRVALASIIFLFLLNIFKFKDKKIIENEIIYIFCCLFFVIFFTFFPIYFYDVIRDLLLSIFDINISQNYLSAGRYDIYILLSEGVLNNRSFFQTIFGLSSGFTSNYLTYYYGENTLLHNDFLRIYLDYGVIGIIIVTIFVISSINKNAYYKTLALYTIILFCTDNVLTYFFYWAVLLLNYNFFINNK